jgi:hypothetical protein
MSAFGAKGMSGGKGKIDAIDSKRTSSDAARWILEFSEIFYC